MTDETVNRRDFIKAAAGVAAYSPAPMRPYHSAYHPKVWRAWLDFGSSMMGDRGVHTLDSVVWSLKLGLPESIEAITFDRNGDTWPLAAMVMFQFAARAIIKLDNNVHTL
jgi:predicted dehydrogenase